jgi:hypothetical protein
MNETKKEFFDPLEHQNWMRDIYRRFHEFEWKWDPNMNGLAVSRPLVSTLVETRGGEIYLIQSSKIDLTISQRIYSVEEFKVDDIEWRTDEPLARRSVKLAYMRKEPVFRTNLGFLHNFLEDGEKNDQ